MKYLVRRLHKTAFYDTYVDWCILHGFPVVPTEWLPKNVFVCYNKNEEPVYCIWAWQTDSKLLWIGFPASNLNVPFKERESGLDYLLKKVNEYAKDEGYATVFTTSGSKPVIDSLTKNDFTVGDIGINHYIKIL